MKFLLKCQHPRGAAEQAGLRSVVAQAMRTNSLTSGHILQVVM